MLSIHITERLWEQQQTYFTPSEINVFLTEGFRSQPISLALQNDESSERPPAPGSGTKSREAAVFIAKDRENLSPARFRLRSPEP